ARLAAAAPGKAITESVCPAKVCRRRTMNQPVTPAMTATIVPASSALTMKGYAKSWCMSVSGFQESPWNTAASGMTVAVHEGSFWLPDDDEPAVGGMQDLDRRPVETAEGLARDHVFRRTFDRAAAGELDHLGDSGCVSLATRGPREGDPPTGPVQPELDEVDAADPGAGVEAVPLRQVADPALRLAGPSSQHRTGSGGQRQQTEDRLDQRRLARSVRPQHGDEDGFGDSERNG